ncbi:MAG: hypothetical protein ACFFDX_07335 [Candidatus Odinarchaeota archaeon]
MKEPDTNLQYNQYYQVISPSEIDIKREDIFYREKYNDIINYIKGMLTNNEYSTIQQYIIPKGLLLINIDSGTDILDFLKLISKNYYLDFIELNYLEISKEPEVFFKNFNIILKKIVEELIPKVNNIEENKNGYDDINEKNKPNKLFLIDQAELTETLLNEKDLLKLFINTLKNYEITFLENGIILIWINKNLNEIEQNSKDIFQIFDLFIKVPLLSSIEREIVLKSFSEKNQKIVFDINQIVNYTQNWEIQEINHLLKKAVFKHFLNSELNETSNEITAVIINLIESGEYIPSLSAKTKEFQEIYNESYKFKPKIGQIQKSQDDKKINYNELQFIKEHIQNQPISEFMLNQLYENAASKNYTELVIIVDKINKKEILEENERKLLAKYPFILNDSPSRAQINLEKAKKRVDHIKQAFGK